MLIDKFKKLLSNRFIQNIGWLGVAELVNRIFRLATTVTLARTFSTYDYGMVSIIYTIFDFGNVFTLRFGLAAKIIHADEQELKIVCDTCYWLNLILCSSLFIIQCIAAYPIAHFYNNDKLILPICIVAIAYLIIPFYTIQATLIERDSRLKVTAFSGAMQAISSNIILVALAVAGMGIWAVVWSMVLSYLVWIPISYRNHSWRPPKSFKIEKWREIASYGSKLLGIDLLGRLRMYLDYLIIGGFLGIDQLGLYFFAFNAGLGLSQSVIYSSTVALFPHLCAVRGNLAQLKNQFFNSLKTIALLLIPLVVLQTSLAQFYVPIVFGQKWVTAIPILVLICCSALPIALSRATSQLLQAVDKSHIDLYWNAIFTAIFAASLLLAVRGGILWVAVAVLITQTLAMPIFTIWINHYIFPKKANL
ncbi:MAG TPA: lipopolysaccharide biosynthesis protein [Coleofasciculaceae cyanobacterium]|jgi:O-antigen/teichoic acid export membrane protein